MRQTRGLAKAMSLSIALALALPLTAQEEERTPVSVPPRRASIRSRALPRLIDIAMERAPKIARARNNLEIAENEKRNAIARFLPQLNVESRKGYLNNEPVNRPRAEHSELMFSLREHLYDPDANATWARYSQAVARLERVRLEYEFQRDEQLRDVAQAYLDWSEVVQQREIDENKRDLLRRQFNVLEAQYKQGLKTKRDVLRIETEIKRLAMDILRRDNQIDLNFQKLASAVGITTKELDAQDIESEEAKPQALTNGNSPELKSENHIRARILTLREKEASSDTRVAQYAFWPRLSLEGEVRYNNNEYWNSPFPFEQNQLWTYQAMLVLRYNIIDFGLRSRDVQIARIRERNVNEEYRQTLVDLNTELREVFLRLGEHYQNVKTSRELLVLEQQAYSILESEYRNGRASYLDLITNLNSLIDARSRFMSSYFGLKKQQVIYSFHQGNLYEKLRQN